MEFLGGLISGQNPVTMVDDGAGVLEKRGLYAIIIALCLVVVFLFGLIIKIILANDKKKEELNDKYAALQKDHQSSLLGIVKEQTQVLTEQVILTEKVETLLGRVTSKLDKGG